MTRLAALCFIVLLAAACVPAVVEDTEAFPAPVFELQTLDGVAVSLADFRGQWVVINFWATWCAPCVAEMPALQALADAAPGLVTVLGVNLREDAETVRAFAAAHAIRFPLLLNPDDATVLAYSVVGLPQTLLVDPAGNIVERAFGPVDVASLQARIGPG